jgi:hypothetical protein
MYEDLETMDASALGKIIGRSTKSIKMDLKRNPQSLPPRFVIPGSRKLLWRVVDVRRWMEAIAAIAEAARVEQRKLNVKLGMGIPTRTARIGHLGKKSTGVAATEHLKKEAA